MANWDYADAIGLKIFDLLNAERNKPEFSPVQFLAGLLTAVVGFQRTAARLDAPAEFTAVHDAAMEYLRAIHSSTNT